MAAMDPVLVTLVPFPPCLARVHPQAGLHAESRQHVEYLACFFALEVCAGPYQSAHGGGLLVFDTPLVALRVECRLLGRMIVGGLTSQVPVPLPFRVDAALRRIVGAILCTNRSEER